MLRLLVAYTLFLTLLYINERKSLLSVGIRLPLFSSLICNFTIVRKQKSTERWLALI